MLSRITKAAGVECPSILKSVCAESSNHRPHPIAGLIVPFCTTYVELIWDVPHPDQFFFGNCLTQDQWSLM